MAFEKATEVLPAWADRYGSKLATPSEAIRLIQPGRRILIASGAAEPVALVEGLVRFGSHLRDNEIVHLLTLGPAPYVQPGMERRFRHTAFFIGTNVREAVQQGRADFMPVFLSEIPALIRSRRVRIDVALIQVSPPDARGYVSLGVSVDIVREAVEAADLVLAEVNPRMPRTHGDSFVHVDRIAKLVPVDRELPELARGELDEVARQIGAHVAKLIPDGATLQVGIGKIPDAVLAALGDRHDLGVHTEMLSDGIMELAEAGVITGRRKTLLRGKMVTSFIMGSRRLYEWADGNPAIEMRASDFTNDPQTIARNDFMVSINSALAVDLTGQVCSDTLEGRFFSGIGGQVDFVRGAARSRGGKAILAFRSTARDGTVSRIQPVLEAGAGVVTSRGDVHYVVTEYGVADLWGKTIRQRASALVAIAHPDFRAELLAAAKARRYVFPDQALPRADYPWTEERLEELPRTGEEILVRPARLTDEEALKEFFYRLGDEDTSRRFLGHLPSEPHGELRTLVDLEEEGSFALVACARDTGELLGVGRYDVDPATRLADLAFAVRADVRGRGIGTALMRRMIEVGRKRGLAGFTAEVAASNRPMLAVFEKSGLRFQTELRNGSFRMEARFEER
jgi:acyl-CoA hydrolase/GNAT superfamily N-acetyltransferase